MRALIVRLSHLGDVVLALPLFHALRAIGADARIAWVVQPEFAALIEPLPGLERVFLFERRGGALAWWRLARELRRWRPEWTLDAQGNAKSAAVTLVSGASRRSGFARVDWRERVGALAINDPARPAVGPHAMQRVEALVRHVAPGAPTRTDPGLSGAELARGRELLRAHLPRGEGPARILHLADAGDPKAWPARSFGALARRLADARTPVLLLSGPAEAEGAAGLARDLPAHEHIRHWTAQRGLRELAALFAAGAQEGVRLVGCDSGPAHLAAACGMGVDLLAGPQDPARTGPWAPSGSVMRHAVHVRVDPPPCQPCRSRRCRHPLGPVCMLELDPERVARALLAADGRLGASGASDAQ